MIQLTESQYKESVWAIQSSGASVVEREREIFIPDKIFEKVAERVLTKDIQSKIVTLENEIKDLKNEDYEVTISDEAAEELLKSTLKTLKKRKIQEIDIIDLHSATKLPIFQIGKIMEKLEGEGVVTHNGED